ncbi:MAG: redoxin domain-containing protein [Porphyromonadaceae bacterium]|nr:redoxin domain-containing protein [Porphyromonadaceae bacterium]
MLYKKIISSLIFSVFTFFIIASAENAPNENSGIKVMTFEDLKPLLDKKTDTTYVVNFWATWCAPCIAEIPYFEEVGEKYKDKKLKILMVSLDFPSHIKSRLIPFMKKENMKNEVVLLDDPNSNRWIPLVDKDWSGAIPATLIYNDCKRKFYPNEFTSNELHTVVEEFINDSVSAE